MTEPRPIAVVTAADGYAGILRAFRDRQAQLGLSGDKLDAIIFGNTSDAAGANRYAVKWLSGMKGLGPKSWGDALGAMGMKIVFVEDPEQIAKLKKHLQSRNTAQIRTLVRIRVTKWLFTSRSGRRAGKRSAAALTKEERARRAQRASKARWKKVREERRKARCAPTEVQS